VCSPHRGLSNDILFTIFHHRLTPFPFFLLHSVQNWVSSRIIRTSKERWDFWLCGAQNWVSSRIICTSKERWDFWLCGAQWQWRKWERNKGGKLCDSGGHGTHGPAPRVMFNEIQQLCTGFTRFFHSFKNSS
jgi:hypothetical protein